MQTINTTGLVLALFAVLALTVLFPVAPVYATLPPRPTLTPTTSAPPTAPEKLAAIRLQAGYTYEGKWSVVQWQAGDGTWHDVDGWRGQVAGGQVRWGVSAKDFGTGPFRWLVYEQANAQLLTTSASFTLPDSSTHVVTVQVPSKIGQ